MSVIIDPFLRQLKGLEDYLAMDRVDDAKNAIEGIRSMLLSIDPDQGETSKQLTVPDDLWLKQSLETIRNRATLDFDTGEATHQSTFSKDIVCWGWYDEQTDTLGRSYRWCGNEPEAGLRLPFNFGKLAALIITVRPLEPKKFNENSVELRINGKPTAVKILSKKGEKVVDIAIVPEQINTEDSIDVSFYLKYGSTPSTLSEQSNDDRKLTFNIVEFCWLPSE